MKLLMVCPHLPHPSWGASTRNYYLLKALAYVHTVSLLALVDSVEERDNLSHLADFTQEIQLIVRPQPRSKRIGQLLHMLYGKSYLLAQHERLEVQHVLNQLLAHHHYHAVLFESVFVAGYQLPQGVKAIIDQHNIEHELLERTYQYEQRWLRKWYNWRESRLIKQFEVEHCCKATLVTATSERDQHFLQRLLQRQDITVVPNGVDVEQFSDCPTGREVAGRIVFTGAMNYYPNVNAVLFFARNCWPLIRAYTSNATWFIVGRHPPAEVQKLARLDGVTVTGAVPDVRPYLAEAEIAIAPLRIGSGTRLKILEALAMHKAVVSTSIGCEGLAVESGKHLVIADSAHTLAREVLRLLRDQARRVALSNAGRALVETMYSWKECGDCLLHALAQIERKE
ncbi:MAG: glycosyltransferase [Ktedonobacteraceae bacterium]|nr:glycosyltransferase [Ktedonobacteraceae bacterium]